MDDQRARARAASDRGLAAIVEPNQLMALDREIRRFLDEGEAEADARADRGAATCRSRATREAARLIEEVTHGCPTLDRDAGADRRAATPLTSTTSPRPSIRAAAGAGRDVFPGRRRRC